MFLVTARVNFVDRITTFFYFLFAKVKLFLCVRVVENCCGSFFCDIESADDDVLQKVNVRQNLSCQTPIEIPYYTIGHDPICYHCRGEESLDGDSEH